MRRQLILDTETTGLSTLDGHRVIEVACVEMINRRLTGNYFHRYINPQREIDPGAEEVHGITLEFLRDKPQFHEIVEELVNYIRDAELIIHNANFDLGFLNYELQLAQYEQPITHYCSVIDTLSLARLKHPGQHNNLDALCRRYKVDNKHREWHGALLDAELLAQVYLFMTGGQAQLFASDEETRPAVNQGQNTKIQKTERKPLQVILPTSEELKAHQDFLELMRKNNLCLWDHLTEGPGPVE